MKSTPSGVSTLSPTMYNSQLKLIKHEKKNGIVKRKNIYIIEMDPQQTQMLEFKDFVYYDIYVIEFTVKN